MRKSIPEQETAKKSKLIKCSKHGLLYDLDVSTGCALCKRERKAAGGQSTRGGRIFIAALLLAVIGICIFIFAKSGEQEPGEAPRPAAGPPPGAALEAQKEKERNAVAAINGLVRALSRLVEDAEAEMPNFGRMQVDLRNLKEGDNERFLSDWRFWAERWKKDVDALDGENLDKKVYIPAGRSEAFRSVSWAIRNMKQVPNPGPGVSLRPEDEGFSDYYLPDENVRKAWLRGIRRLLDQAAAQLK